MIVRQQHRHAASGRGIEQLAGDPQRLLLLERRAHRHPLRGQERIGHAAADQDGVDPPQEIAQDADLGGDLGAADHQHERRGGPGQQAVELLHFALQQQPRPLRVRRQARRHADRGGVRAVGGAERVVDVDLPEPGQPGGEAPVVGFFAGVEPQVLQHQDLARAEPRGGRRRGRPDAVGRGPHRRVEQGGEPLRHRPDTQSRLRRAGRTTQVAHQHQPRPVLIQHRPDRRQRGADARVVGDLSVRERHVEVDPHQHRSPPQVELAQGTHPRCRAAAHAERSCGSPSGSGRRTIFTRVMR